MELKNLHPQIIEKEGKKEFVVLPYEEFLTIPKTLQDCEDLKDLRMAKAQSKNDPGVSLKEVKDMLSKNSQK